MRLNKTLLNEIVTETIHNIILEAIANNTTYGQKGHITGLISGKDFVDIPQSYLNIIDSGSRSLSPHHLDSYFDGTKTYTAYLQYKKAIESKNGRAAVSFFMFLDRLRHGFMGVPMSVFESNGSYMIGVIKNGVFLCVYMAPKSRLSMYVLIKDLLEYDNVVFAVTDDLGVMLQKLNVPKYKDNVTARFRGRDCEKEIYGSTYEAAEKGALLVGLAGKMHSMKSLLNDPKVAQLLQSNPNLANQIMSNPGLLQQIMSNPNMMQQYLSTIENNN